MNDGMDTNAVVITMIILSSTVLRRSAANAPRTMPAIAALNAGKHVYIDKPLAVTYESAQRIADAAKNAPGATP